MPKVSKKSRDRKKPRLGPFSSSANTEATDEGKHIPGPSTNPGRFTEQTAPFMSLPVDVLLEIATHCHPLDLLRLSRVSKKLRAVLLTKRNRSVWVRARNGLDLPMPACPEDMSEPKYAFFVFEPVCMLCDSTASLHVDYASRIKLCEGCRDIHVKAGYTIIRELDSELKFRRDRSLKRVIFDLLPEACGGFRYQIMGGAVNIQEWFFYLRFYQPEFEAVVKEYHTVSQSSGGDIKVLEEYIQRRKAHTLERLKFHSAVVKWARDRERAQDAAKSLVPSTGCTASWRTSSPCSMTRAGDGCHSLMLWTAGPIVSNSRGAKGVMAWLQKP
ncbi:hypothetical protein V8D89_003584 [Ganoderma adspersum]